MLSVGGNVLSRLTRQTATGLKGIADLLVQLVAVGEDDEGGASLKLAADLLGEEDHGVALSASLGVPENAQLAVLELSGLVGFHRLVDTEVLVVAGEDLGDTAARVVVQDEVFKEIHEILLVTDTEEHGLQIHRSHLILLESLPFVEELVFGAEGTDLGLQTVGEHEEGVEVEQMGDGIQIIGVVAVIGGLDVHVLLFQLDEQERDTVDKAHDIGSAAVQIAVDLHLLDREKMVFGGLFEIEDGGVAGLVCTARLSDLYGDAVAEHGILFLVDLHEGGRGYKGAERLDGRISVFFRHPVVIVKEGAAQIPRQHDLLVGSPAQRAVLAQHLGVVGVDHIPAQLMLQHVAGAVLD